MGYSHNREGYTRRPGGDFEPLPKGWYPVEVERSEYRRNRGGHEVALGLVVQSGDYSERWVFLSFNVENNSAEAQQIARDNLDRIYEAVGFTNEDSDRLAGKRFEVKLGVESEKQANGYDPKNTFKAARPWGGGGSKPWKSGAAPAASSPGSGGAPQGDVPDFPDSDIPF